MEHIYLIRTSKDDERYLLVSKGGASFYHSGINGMGTRETMLKAYSRLSFRNHDKVSIPFAEMMALADETGSSNPKMGWDSPYYITHYDTNSGTESVLFRDTFDLVVLAILEDEANSIAQAVHRYGMSAKQRVAAYNFTTYEDIRVSMALEGIWHGAIYDVGEFSHPASNWRSVQPGLVHAIAGIGKRLASAAGCSEQEDIMGWCAATTFLLGDAQLDVKGKSHGERVDLAFDHLSKFSVLSWKDIVTTYSAIIDSTSSRSFEVSTVIEKVALDSGYSLYAFADMVQSVGDIGDAETLLRNGFDPLLVEAVYG